MKVLAVSSALLAGALCAARVAACPCSDDAAGGLGLTRPDERFGAAVVATSRRAVGRFDAQGEYSALDADEGESSEELLLRVAVRTSPELEWLLELGGAAHRLHAGQFAERAIGLGDVIARGRYVLRQESMPHASWPLPAVALSALLRAPLGVMAEQRSAGYGSGGAQLGLGTWEAGLGLDASRSPWPELVFLASVEAAYRFADDVLERERRLGPRAELTLGVRAFPQASLSGSVAVRARLTGDVTLDGKHLSGTGEQLLTLALGAAHLDLESGIRTALTVSFDPPTGGLVGRSATTAAALACSLGYGF